jgi:AAA domain-containing protein
MPTVVDQIRAWAAQLDYWERMALEMVATGKELIEADYQALLDYHMQDAGLVQMPTRPKVEFSRPSTAETRTSYKLERLFNLRNVNALPANQELRFGPQLTLVYGNNGAGKTGYTRPLGCAAFARGDRYVLSNATVSPDPKSVPQADIEVSRNGVPTVVTWTRGKSCSELQGFYVFDNTSSSVHLTRSNPLSISPSGLSLLTRLADVTDEVRFRLKVVLEQRNKTVDFGPLFTGASKVATHISTLGASTDLVELQKLATLTPDEHSRILQLQREIVQLKAQDVPKRVASLRQGSRDLRSLLSFLAVSELSVGDEATSVVEHLVTNLQRTRQDAERSGAEQFKSSFFTEVGTETWREFVAAARSLAESEGKRGAAYPSHEDRCLLCRQALSDEAIDLIQRLWGFLASDSTAQFGLAQGACKSKIRELEGVSMGYFAEDSGTRRLLIDLAPDLATAVEKQIVVYSERRSELISALQKGSLGPVTELALSSAEKITAIIKSRELVAEMLEGENASSKLNRLENELRELEHREMLAEQLPAIKAQVEAKRWVNKGRQALGSTRNITTKHNELFQELVTERFIKLFESNLARFNQSLRIAVDVRGHKGETVRQIVLCRDAFPTAYPIESILSEGEKQAVALADFLTEAALDEGCTGMILDDPVSSFDLGARKNVALQLAELARTRQIIVFTHDLAFLYDLKAHAKDLSVGTVTHWIERGPDGTPGIVFLDNSPACEREYKSAHLARERYTRAKSAPPQERQWLLKQGFGALRTSYEAFVIFELFEGVVERFEERISFGRLADVSLDREIVAEVISRMESLSRHIDAHLHSDSFAGEEPGPDVLLAEIESFEKLRKKHKERKKSVQQAVAQTASAASEHAQPQVGTAKTASPESLGLEKRTRLANQLRTRN